MRADNGTYLLSIPAAVTAAAMTETEEDAVKEIRRILKELGELMADWERMTETP